MRFVPVKSVEQQDIQAAHRMRAILLRHRTALINQMRGLLGERGFAICRSPEEFKRAVLELLRASADELTSFCRTLLTELLVHLRAIEERIHFIEISIHSFMKRSALCRKIAQIPGIGPITATAIVAAVGDARQFRVICRFSKSRSNLVRHHTQLPNATCLFELSRCLATGSTCIAQWTRPATRSISCCGRIATRLLRAATSRRPSMVDQRGPVAQQDGIAQDEISQSHVIP
jgi:transposase